MLIIIFIVLHLPRISWCFTSYHSSTTSTNVQPRDAQVLIWSNFTLIILSGPMRIKSYTSTTFSIAILFYTSNSYSNNFSSIKLHLSVLLPAIATYVLYSFNNGTPSTSRSLSHRVLSFCTSAHHRIFDSSSNIFSWLLIIHDPSQIPAHVPTFPGWTYSRIRYILHYMFHPKSTGTIAFFNISKSAIAI